MYQFSGLPTGPLPLRVKVKSPLTSVLTLSRIEPNGASDMTTVIPESLALHLLSLQTEPLIYALPACVQVTMDALYGYCGACVAGGAVGAGGFVGCGLAVGFTAGFFVGGTGVGGTSVGGIWVGSSVGSSVGISVAGGRGVKVARGVRVARFVAVGCAWEIKGTEALTLHAKVMPSAAMDNMSIGTMRLNFMRLTYLQWV